jgi:RHS repeat-associated protein
LTSLSFLQQLHDYRLTSLTLKNGAANVSNLAYAYVDGINLSGITDTVTPANTVALGYNNSNSLQYASGAWGQSNYYYDIGGNRTYDINTVSAVTTTKTTYYDVATNHMNSTYNGTTQLRSFAYDAGGNISNDNRPGEAFVFTYNNRNRMSSVTRNAVAYATYGYNALEQLTTRSTAAVGGPVGQVAYIYDLDGHLIAEATASTGATTRDYIWAAANDNTPVDLPLAVAEAATLYMVHSDHLGRPIRMTDSTKATVWQAQYKPFGEPVTLSGTKANNLRFPGQYFQIETGFAYNWHRHYDPTTGRYTQPDPLRFVDGPSVYAYAGSSPAMHIDFAGLAAGGGEQGRLAKCASLKKRIENLDNEIKRQMDNLDSNPGNLPPRLSPTEKLIETIRGHRTQLNIYWSQRNKAQDEYTKNRCDDSGGSCEACGAALVGGLCVAACLAQAELCVPAIVGGALVAAPSQ